ncbi:MAG TPA: patatin-like phospholipase family protein [Rhizomicrobium sp.]|nr:patatin-like phospholipase family protein [Rhizomicrobium sp.]
MAAATQKAPPIPVYVIFQGGGAKLCMLMAACSVLKKYQADGEIRILRAAGSSAGAIAAAMLSSTKDMDFYKEAIGALAKDYVDRMKEWKWNALRRVAWGGAYFRRVALENFFKELFEKKAGHKTVGDLKYTAKPPLLYTTNLYTMKSETADEGDSLSQALARSCRFPLAFTGFGVGDSYVDGGLAMNLPVDGLKKNAAADEKFIAISFASVPADIPEKPNLKNYMQQLFSAAIESGVERSREILGDPNVFYSETSIETFDFEKAMGDGLNDLYKGGEALFKAWLEDWIKRNRTVVPQPAVSAKRLYRPELKEKRPWAPAVVNDIGDRLKAEACLKADEVFSCETAMFDENRNFNGSYRSLTIMRFQVLRRLNILQFSFQIGKEKDFDAAQVGCAVTDNRGESLDFNCHVEDLGIEGDFRSYRVYVLFANPLTAASVGQPYTLEYQYEGVDPYPKWGRGTEASTITQCQGDADAVVLAVAFPARPNGFTPQVRDVIQLGDDERRALGITAEDDETFVLSAPLTIDAEYQRKLNLDFNPKAYCLVARKATKVKRNQAIGFVIE